MEAHLHQPGHRVLVGVEALRALTRSMLEGGTAGSTVGAEASGDAYTLLHFHGPRAEVCGRRPWQCMQWSPRRVHLTGAAMAMHVYPVCSKHSMVFGVRTDNELISCATHNAVKVNVNVRFT